jgi:hypothetical protein
MISPVKVWRNQKYVARMIGKSGVIASWTIIRVPPADFGYQAPYPVVLVTLYDGDSITVQMVCKRSGNDRSTGHDGCQADDNHGPMTIPHGIKVKPYDYRICSVNSLDGRACGRVWQAGAFSAINLRVSVIIESGSKGIEIVSTEPPTTRDTP